MERGTAPERWSPDDTACFDPRLLLMTLRDGDDPFPFLSQSLPDDSEEDEPASVERCSDGDWKVGSVIDSDLDEQDSVLEPDRMPAGIRERATHVGAGMSQTLPEAAPAAF